MEVLPGQIRTAGAIGQKPIWFVIPIGIGDTRMTCSFACYKESLVKNRLRIIDPIQYYFQILSVVK